MVVVVVVVVVDVGVGVGVGVGVAVPEHGIFVIPAAAPAYKVGITVEKADIADLTEAISDVPQADAKALFERLRTASQRHLTAFERAAAGDLPAGTGQQAQRGMQNQQGQPGQQQRSKDGSQPGRMGGMRGTGNGTPPASCPNS